MDSFECLYEEYYPQVYGYLLKLCKSESIAEEITQDTFFRILKNINHYRGDCKFSVWACQIARNSYFSYIKKNNKITDFPIEILSDDKVENLDEMMANKDTALKIHEILHHIEAPYKEVFWMRVFGELAFAEIARVHGKSESWARVTYHRAKLKIKEALK